MKDWIDVGAAPPMETPAQLGSTDYVPRARRECRAYIGLLRRALGEEPPGAALGIRANCHDFGTYLSVVCYYDDQTPEALDYAFRCEAEGPEEWDQEALNELSQTTERKG